MRWTSAKVNPVISKCDAHRAQMLVGTVKLVMTRTEAIWLANQLADVAAALSGEPQG